MEIKKGDIVLCKFYFSNLQTYKNRLVIIFKSYRNLTKNSYFHIKKLFCSYHNCNIVGN